MNSRHRLRLPVVLAAAALAVSCGSDGTGPDYDPVTITTRSLPNGLTDHVYNAGINANGGDGEYSWRLAGGELPPGLAITTEDLTDDDAVITGIPEQVGTYQFTLLVESGDGQTDRQGLSIEIQPGDIPLGIDNVALAPALVGGPYDVQIGGAGGESTDYVITLVDGTLPPGLEFTEDDRIVGEPTATDTTTLTFEVEAAGEVVQETFELRVLANQPEDFHLTVFEVVDVDPAIRPHLDAAVAEWEAALTEDLEPIHIPPATLQGDWCGGFGEAVNGTSVDDLLLVVNIAPIDGEGQVLGQAGPCGTRTSETSDSLPVLGILTLDSEDLEPYIGTSTLTYLISHEIAHVLGFGSFLWEDKELVVELGTDSATYVGQGAVDEYHDLGGEGPIPLETDGGEGTADSHWDENEFDIERLTGFTEGVGVPQPLSRMSLAAMQDMGFGVDFSVADPYTLPLAELVAGDARAVEGQRIDRLYDGPIVRFGREASLDEATLDNQPR